VSIGKLHKWNFPGFLAHFEQRGNRSMSKMVAVKELVPGNILSDAVLSITGKVLLGKNVELTARHISLLITWDVQGVFINAAEGDLGNSSQESESKIKSEEYIQFTKEYDGVMASTAQSFEVIQERKIIPVTNLKNTAGEIYSSIAKNSFEIMNYLLIEDYKLADAVSRHSVMVAYFSGLIARQMKWSENDITGVTLASLMHDIGNLVANKSIDFRKQAHIAETAGLLKKTSGLSGEVILGIVQHREYMNGSGFPKGSTGSQIHPYAKIIAVADAFHNLAYTDKYTNPFPILDMLTREMYGKFDADVCQNFISRVRDSLLFNKVSLSNGEMAEIVFFNKNHCYAAPVVKMANNEIIDLAERKDLTIQQIVLSKINL
jgi:HD-GYP domain-containing protein (c-di-GMP phosphodiesterase class II)